MFSLILNSGSLFRFPVCSLSLVVYFSRFVCLRTQISSIHCSWLTCLSQPSPSFPLVSFAMISVPCVSCTLPAQGPGHSQLPLSRPIWPLGSHAEGCWGVQLTLWDVDGCIPCPDVRLHQASAWWSSQLLAPSRAGFLCFMHQVLK